MRTKAKDDIPHVAQDALKQLGAKLREARIQRGWTQREFAQRVGVHESTLVRLEAGDAGVTTAVLACALNALGGLQGFCEPQLHPKVGGALIETAIPRRRVGGVRIPRRLNLEAYPQLKQLAWNRTTKDIDAEDALSLYERNWRFVDVDALSDKEAKLIDRLKKKFGHGVLNV
ncbi:helix-turn-helix domain-containing protein [Chitinimonas arctica]|nr:helix-turn-helix transcriptional regulator [Chitinimonas arctica]